MGGGTHIMEGFIIAGVAVVAAGITWLATWDYWHKKYSDLLREVAAERESAAQAVADVKIRETVYREVTMGDVAARRRFEDGQ